MKADKKFIDESLPTPIAEQAYDYFSKEWMEFFNLRIWPKIDIMPAMLPELFIMEEALPEIEKYIEELKEEWEELKGEVK